jgi:integrase
MSGCPRTALAAELDRWKPYGLAGRLLAGAGLRAAEFAALRISDLDLERGTVSVTRTLTRNRKTDEWVIGTPKSRRGRREVPILDDDLLHDLVNYVRDHPRSNERDAPLFYGRAVGGHTADPTKPLDGHVFYQWHLKPAARRIGIPQLRVHDLRHIAATLWHDDGIPLSVISRWLGHASVAVTDRVYAPTAQRRLQHVARSVPRRPAGRARRAGVGRHVTVCMSRLGAPGRPPRPRLDPLAPKLSK